MRIASLTVSNESPFLLIAGPCVAESLELCLEVAATMQALCRELGIGYIFKASYDKANRSSALSFRGHGRTAGLAILAEVKRQLAVPVLTDVHDSSEIDEVAAVVDVLQTPAFLCRQTDFIQAVAATGKPVNLKKGQFLAPGDMKNVVDKARAANQGADNLMVCERGVSFGYHNLVSDMRSLSILRQCDCPIIFDATHSVQLPGGLGDASGGERRFVPVLARAAVATGVAGVFMETHPNPDQALSDGANSWPLSKMRPLLTSLKAIDQIVKSERVWRVEDDL